MENNQARRTCDIVMKGGITSGVVFPRAIAKLATRFTFKNIGGTSAGAIAAAAAAAAEFCRIRSGTAAGFEMLDGLGNELAGKPSGSRDTMLFSLFAPNAGTKKSFAILTGPLSSSSTPEMIFRSLWLGIKSYPIPGLLGAVPGAALAFASYSGSAGTALTWTCFALGVLGALVGGLLAVAAAFLYQLVTALPKNNFGLCSGMPDDNKTRSVEPLTFWLTSYLNKVAGIAMDGRPLTFGDLWNPTGDPDNQGRMVNLEMMTTNLTHGRPYRLPLRSDADLRENHLFYFRKDEFCRLFPPAVVTWMAENPRPIREGSDPNGDRLRERENRKQAGYYPLPAPQDLPVVVATRMSLSFPVLLSMIPLYSIDYTIEEEHRELERCWFTDGGVCSNFPIHFFDAPLPRRPTFSINLTEKPLDTPEADLVPTMDNFNVISPIERWNRFDQIVSADASIPREPKGSFGKIMGFAGTLISTMQNWNDATQSRLPGFRDRIARIPLTSKQGGLNLNMPPDAVSFLSEQGTKCGDMFIEHFDVPAAHPKMNWENHRWIRVRSMFAAFERMLNETLLACDDPENGDVSYEEWLKFLDADKTGEYAKLSYPPTKKQIKAVIETIAAMREMQEMWNNAGTAAEKAPRPRPVLRPRAQI